MLTAARGVREVERVAIVCESETLVDQLTQTAIGCFACRKRNESAVKDRQLETAEETVERVGESIFRFEEGFKIIFEILNVDCEAMHLEIEARGMVKNIKLGECNQRGNGQVAGPNRLGRTIHLS
jgi:hypothetical protein